MFKPNLIARKVEINVIPLMLHTNSIPNVVFDLNLNLNSLLVKRQIDNPSPGAVTGGN